MLTRFKILLGVQIIAEFSVISKVVQIFSALRGSIPPFINISDGKMHEVKVCDFLLAEPGTFHIIDRGCLDFERLFAMNLTRAKTNRIVKRVY